MKSTAPQRAWAIGLAVLALLIVAPVCGAFRAGRPRPSSTIDGSGITGIGLNCHGEMLPIDKIRAIGVQWVRLDFPPSYYTVAKLKPLVDYYRGFGQLWILPQTVSNPAATARTMLDAGITDIEVFNEPEQAHISPSSYARTFKAIRSAVGTSARMYGPAVGTWGHNQGYVQACLSAGMKPDAISFHGYSQGSFNELSSWVEDARQFGYPVVISELGFPDHLGPNPYRIRMNASMGSLFVNTKRVLAGTPWCWYDGPNPAGNENSGLFDWDDHTGRFSRPNSNYRDVSRAIGASG